MKSQLTREEVLAHLTATSFPWGQISAVNNWILQDGQYVHTIHDPISLDDVNRAKIKPNTKIRILSPEHSKYVKRMVFGAGMEWADFLDRETRKTEAPYLYFFPDLLMCCGGSECVFDIFPHKEIFIELPKKVSMTCKCFTIDDVEEEQDVINLNNAPEGATHCYDGNNTMHSGYYKRDQFCAYKWCYGLWMNYTNDMDWFEDKCKQISAQQPCMPEVGEECEAYEYLTNQDRKATYIGEDPRSKDSSWKMFSSVTTGVPFFSDRYRFSPLKTEREKLYDDCIGALKETRTDKQEIVNCLIDAGLIKRDVSQKDD